MQTYVTGAPMACIVYGTMFMGNEELIMFTSTRDFKLINSDDNSWWNQIDADLVNFELVLLNSRVQVHILELDYNPQDSTRKDIDFPTLCIMSLSSCRVLHYCASLFM